METTAAAAEWEEEIVTNPADTEEETAINLLVDTEDPTTTQEIKVEANLADMEEETAINLLVDMEDPTTTLVDRAVAWEAGCPADNLEVSQVDPAAAWSLGLSRRECRLLRDLPRRRGGKYHLLS
jgi:hypothetical protein